MTALLTATPRPGDVDECPVEDWTDEGVLMVCERRPGHDGDHYDLTDKTSWRIEEQPHA